MNYDETTKVLKELQVRVGGKVNVLKFLDDNNVFFNLNNGYRFSFLYGTFALNIDDAIGYSPLISTKDMAQFLKELEELYPAPKEHKYLSDDISCPECKSENVVWGDFEPGDDYAFREHSCKDCGISWTEFYDLSYIEIEE